MPMIRAMRMFNAIEAGTISGAQLQTLLADPVKLGEWNVLVGMPGQARRMAASSVTMSAVLASSAAMNAVFASSTAMNAVAASSTAMAAVLASSAAMNAVFANKIAVAAMAASSTAMAAVFDNKIAVAAVFDSSTAMAAMAASSTAMAAMAASSTAMAAMAASKAALLACWNSETALTALRSSPAALTALLASPYKQTFGDNHPSGMTSTMVVGKTILLQSRNTSGNDTNTLATKFQNGVAVGSHVYSTTTTNSTQMVAFQDIRHIAWASNAVWYGDMVKVD